MALLRHSGEECHFAEIVGIVAALDLLRTDELVNVLHGDDGGLAVEIEDQKLLALLVCELLSALDGILLSDVEEPIFEEKDIFFIFNSPMLLLITFDVKIRLLKTFLYYQNCDGTSMEMGNKKDTLLLITKSRY